MGNIVGLVFFAVLYRALSGVRNGAMYMPREMDYMYPHYATFAMWGSMALLLSILLPSHWYFLPPGVAAWLLASGMIASGIINIAALQYTRKELPKWLRDLHLWTTLEGVILTAVLCVGGQDGVAAAILSVYPGVLLQKSLINIFIERRWDDNGTDDPTGKTYGIPSIGIKIPRTTQRTRRALAIISLIILAIYAIFTVYRNK